MWVDRLVYCVNARLVILRVTLFVCQHNPYLLCFVVTTDIIVSLLDHTLARTRLGELVSVGCVVLLWLSSMLLDDGYGNCIKDLLSAAVGVSGRFIAVTAAAGAREGLWEGGRQGGGKTPINRCVCDGQGNRSSY